MALTNYNQIYGLTLEQLTERMINLGLPKYRAKQVFSFLYKGIVSYDDIHHIPKSLRSSLTKLYPIQPLQILEKQQSKKTGTYKFLLGLPDGCAIEAVVLTYNHGLSLCMSSQVGCRMGCTFCASGQDGLVRNLSAGEMILEILTIERELKESISNLVLMGTGEPFDNFEALLQFLRVVHEEDGFHLGYRHITISTCGLADPLRRFANQQMPVNIAISLHHHISSKRALIMPIEKKYNLDDILEAARYYEEKTGRRVTFEYILINNFNESTDDAKMLAKKLKGLMGHVNLIPYNQVDGVSFKPPSEQKIRAFQQVLHHHNINTTLRRTLGDDIDGACGQLRSRMKKQIGEKNEIC